MSTVRTVSNVLMVTIETKTTRLTFRIKVKLRGANRFIRVEHHFFPSTKNIRNLCPEHDLNYRNYRIILVNMLFNSYKV
jgi:hypothetical protein